MPRKAHLADTNLVVTLMSIFFANKFLKWHHSIVMCAMNMHDSIFNSFCEFIE